MNDTGIATSYTKVNSRSNKLIFSIDKHPWLTLISSPTKKTTQTLRLPSSSRSCFIKNIYSYMTRIVVWAYKLEIQMRARRQEISVTRRDDKANN